MTQRLTPHNVRVGDKFNTKQSIGRIPAGILVEVYDFDCDGWPRWRVIEEGVHKGYTDCDGWDRFNNYMERATTIYSDRWVVFNSSVYSPACSEAEAKRIAEELAQRTGQRAFIAQAHNSVEVQATVWDRGE